VIDLPANDLVPGAATAVPTPFATFLLLLSILNTFLERKELVDAGSQTDHNAVLAKLRHTHGKLYRHSLTLHDKPKLHLPSQKSMLADLIHAAQAVVRDLSTPAALQDDASRRTLFLMDIGLAYAHGMAASDAFVSGYDALDQWEFTPWLRANGASEAALASVVLRGCYDFVFGFQSGNLHQHDVGAGTAARAMGRLMFTYSGAVFYKMQAGMGDTIFAPYYQVLEKLGVKFKFFHAATALRVSDDGMDIGSIEMVRQADLIAGDYQPLVEVRGLPCWPSAPDWSQLKDAAQFRANNIDFESEEYPFSGTKFVLEKGRDFDQVLLGASLGSLPRLTADLVEKSPRWALMLKSLRSVGTGAAQFWLDKTAAQLGWDEKVAEHNNQAAIPKQPLRTILTGFAEPLDTWADMSHLLPVEDWPKPEPAFIAYFCSPAPDGETLTSFKAKVRAWVNDELPAIWPKATDLPWHNGDFEDQYFRVNMFGSERYVLSVTNSVFHRLAPGESGFANLVLAGDWTRCGLNAGCVEAATMSGIAAASALSGVPLLNVGAEDIAQDATANEAARFATFSVTGASWPLNGFFARGEMTGWFTYYALPRAEVAKLLPEGVHLGTSKLVPAGMHPVGLSFCKYHNVRGSFVPDFLAMQPYNELTFAIPDTRTDEGGDAPFLYPYKLYVDNSAAIMAGRLFYAMNKSPATMSMTDTIFTAQNPQHLTVKAEFVQQQDPISLANHPAIASITDILGTAFVTRSPVGGLLYNAFDMQLDKAWVAPVHGRLSVLDPSRNGIPAANMQVAPLLASKTNGLPGAMRIWCSWSLSNPLDGTRIRHTAKAKTFLGAGQ
jgi:uncharacterized protein with NAD-binding domain and iron-sulfur cluster